MRNKFSGTADLEGSDGKKYHLKFGTNAICKIEDKYDKSISDISKSLLDEKTLRVGVIRTMLQVSMREKLTDEEVGDLVDDIGMMEIGRVLGVMFNGDSVAGTAAPSETPQSAGELTGASVS